MPCSRLVEKRCSRWMRAAAHGSHPGASRGSARRPPARLPFTVPATPGAQIEAQAKIARIEKIERKGWAETDGKKDDETPATDTKPRAGAAGPLRGTAQRWGGVAVPPSATLHHDCCTGPRRDLLRGAAAAACVRVPPQSSDARGPAAVARLALRVAPAAAKKRKAEDEDAGAKPKRRKEEPQKGAQAAKAVAPATPRVKASARRAATRWRCSA